MLAAHHSQIRVLALQFTSMSATATLLARPGESVFPLHRRQLAAVLATSVAQTLTARTNRTITAAIPKLFVTPGRERMEHARLVGPRGKRRVHRPDAPAGRSHEMVSASHAVELGKRAAPMGVPAEMSAPLRTITPAVPAA